MNRKCMFLSAALSAAGVLFGAGTVRAQPPMGAPPGAPPAAPAAPAVRPVIAVFNMAAVMRDFNQAKYQVYLLNQKKDALSKDLMAWRGEYIQIQQLLRESPQHPEKDAKLKRMVELSRWIEDKDREINKLLNDDASKIIVDLYDKINSVVVRTADMNGYHIVFAYPDAVTKEELDSAYIKELKLKPPAAQPFYVAAHVDLTQMMIKTLNTWYPPKDQAGNIVDVSKLNLNGQGLPGPSPTPGPAPGPAPSPTPVPPVPTPPRM